MDKTEVRKFITQELGRRHKPDDIIKEVCERTGMSWGDAQKFVRQVYTENHGEISKSQNGVLMILVVAEILDGFSISASVLVATLSGWIILLLRLPVPYLGNVVYFTFGVILIIAGINGFVKMNKPKR